MSSPSPLVFTSIQSNRQGATSDVFRGFGNTGEVPCPVSESDIYPITTTTGSAFNFANDAVYKACANLLQRTVDPKVESPSNNTVKSKSAIPNIIDPPEVTISFGEKNLSESTSVKMMQWGFRKESQGRRQFYRGSLKEENLVDIIKAGGELDTFAPYGACNIRGFLAFNYLQKMILYIAASGWKGKPVTSSLPEGMVDSDKYTPSEFQDERIKFKTPKNFRHVGIPLPYFQGLVLPDKDIGSNFVSTYLRPFLGTGEQRATVLSSLRSGWRSLSTTQQGMALSHMIFCIDLALRTGAKPVFLTPNKVYSGTVLQGAGLMLRKGSRLCKSTASGAELANAIGGLSKHEDALATIADIINPKIFEDLAEDGSRDTSNDISPEIITTPRLLHNLLRRVTLTVAEMKVVRENVRFLKFSQTYWNVSNLDQLQTTISTIVDDGFLPDEAPIAYLVESFFTKDSTLSTLLAYGAMAPSMIGRGNNISLRIPASGKYLTDAKLREGHLFLGLPVFVKPIQESYEDWDEMKRTGAIHFKVAGKKGVYSKVQGASTTIPFQNTAVCTGIYNSLKARCLEKKRKRDESDDEDIKTSKSTKRETKKSRVMKEGITELDLLFDADANLHSDAESEDDIDME